MKLSTRDREVIAAAQMQAGKPVSEIRKLCRYKEHSVRYSLQRALDQGLIVRRCFVNLNRLGFNQYELYFSLSAGKKESRAALIKSLGDLECVSWVGQLGGDFQYGLNLAARSIAEVSRLFSGLSEKFGALFQEKVFAERISFTYFGNKYLTAKPRAAAPMSYSASSDIYAIDATDRRILSEVTRVGEGSSRLLARKLSMPQTTVDYRLRKLEKSGVIVGYYFELQPRELGIQSYMLLVCMKTISEKTRKAFEQFCLQHPNVVIQIHCMGSWDFEVGVDAEDPMQVTGIVENLYDRFGAEISWVKTLPAFRNLKVAEYPFRA